MSGVFRPDHAPGISVADAAALIGAAGSYPGTLITGASVRAHQVRAGDLFAAFAGQHAHGADYAEQAISAGAVAVLTDPAGASKLANLDVPVLVHEEPRQVLGVIASAIHGDPSAKLRVIGITGTSGKTTTSYFVRAGLAAAGRITGLVGTVETRIADAIVPSAFTTPEAPDLQGLFASMVEAAVTDVVMEVSSHALALGRVGGTRFAIGAFTNLSQDHLDFHTDLEDYFAAKSLLFDGRAAREIVVIDDEWGPRLVTDDTITVSKIGEASWRATNIRVADDGGQLFVATGPQGQSFEVVIALPGTFNVSNALLAVAILDSVGVEEKYIQLGLSQVAVPGRMERVDAGQDFLALVDYSHKPAAVGLALNSVRAQARGKVVIVLGAGGDRDSAKRPMMGKVAADLSDVVIVTDDNPRSEDPAMIRAQVLAGIPADTRATVREIGDRRAAIRAAIALAEPGDVVLVAGKGHETGQKVGDTVLPFDDRTELRAALLNDKDT